MKRAIKILMVDPSLFTYPHDSRLSAALSKDCDVRLIGRPLRKSELDSIDHPFPVTPLFYKLSEYLRAKCGPLKTVAFVKGLEHIIGLMLLVRYAFRYKPDVIHFQWLPLPLADWVFVKILRRVCPVFISVHDLQPFNENPTSRLQTVGYVHVIKECDGVFVHTAKSAEVLEAWGIRKAGILYHGLPPDIEDVSMCRLERRSQPGTPEIAAPGVLVNVLIAGFIKQYKGIDIALKSLKLLPESVRKRIQLTIAGEQKISDSDLQGLQKIIQNDEKIKWKLGYLPNRELLTLMSEADLFLFPYRHIEGSGIFSQALRFERPVIASDIGMFSEIVHKYNCGLLISPTPSDLAEKLTLMLSDSAVYGRCVEGAKRANSALPSWETVATKTMGFYSTYIPRFAESHL